VLLTYRRLFSPEHTFMASKLIEREKPKRG
jgi:putative ABC transport system permease protein